MPFFSDPNPDPYGNQNPWNQWNRQGFRVWFSRARRAGNQPECLPTAYKPQLITRRSLVQVQPPQPNKKHPGFPGCFYFRYYDGVMILRIVTQFSEGRQRTAPRRGTPQLFSFHSPCLAAHCTQAFPPRFLGTPEICSPPGGLRLVRFLL